MLVNFDFGLSHFLFTCTRPLFSSGAPSCAAWRIVAGSICTNECEWPFPHVDFVLQVADARAFATRISWAHRIWGNHNLSTHEFKVHFTISTFVNCGNLYNWMFAWFSILHAWWFGKCIFEYIMSRVLIHLSSSVRYAFTIFIAGPCIPTVAALCSI